MPLYDGECQRCHATFEYVETMARCHCVPKCPACASYETVKVLLSVARARVPDRGWEYENNGRGRYIGQLAPRPDVKDPDAYCRSRRELVEKATKQGRKVTLV